jgi:DNA-binding NarL/FixJ family response regulator
MPDSKTNNLALITDTQYLTGKALKSLLTSRGFSVRLAADADSIRQLISQEGVSLIVTDHTVDEILAIDELIALKESAPETAVLVLTAEISQLQIRQLHNSGIRNVSLRSDDRDELIRALEAAVKGRQHYSDGILDILLSRQESTETVGLLTRSELEIVRQIASGLTTKEIAARKRISFHTVMTHRKNIFRKLGVSSSSELLMYAIRTGMIDGLKYRN